MSDVRIVARGVDTLIVNAYHTDERLAPVKRPLDEGLVKLLDGWKQEAQGVHDEVPTTLKFNKKLLLMCPNGGGRGQWPWMLKSRDITLYISRGQWNGIATVRFSSEYLWSSPSLTDALIELQVFLDELFHNELYLQLSEVHLCADVAGWQDIDQLDRHTHFVTHSLKRGVYAVPDWGYDAKLGDYGYGLQRTGFDFSRGGSVSVSLYDKTREVRQSGKTWFEDIWRHNGWMEEDDGRVWRVELRLKREALHELSQEGKFHGIEDVYELPDLLPLLWAYGVGCPGAAAAGAEVVSDDAPYGWLRCVVPPGKRKKTRRSRWPTHPAWDVVQRAFLGNVTLPEQVGKMVRKRHEQHSINKGLEAVMGYLTSLAAWSGGELSHEGVDLSVVLHWLMERGEEYLQREERDFSAEVQRKRVKFGQS
jgi:hypothetical protein